MADRAVCFIVAFTATNVAILNIINVIRRKIYVATLSSPAGSRCFLNVANIVDNYLGQAFAWVILIEDEM